MDDNEVYLACRKAFHDELKDNPALAEPDAKVLARELIELKERASRFETALRRISNYPSETRGAVASIQGIAQKALSSPYIGSPFYKD